MDRCTAYVHFHPIPPLIQPGHEYECWALPEAHFHEAVFHKEPGFSRMIPQVGRRPLRCSLRRGHSLVFSPAQIIFLIIVIGLCMATGVCLVRAPSPRSVVGTRAAPRAARRPHPGQGASPAAPR